ncbi:hypothetical protein BDV95DRAFT_611809 [Massariosphaeria phaeospora]|uniref:F-box domain-containing protein n=1 Tax=Massariosphaeria phaeospora TaxID=100035 RepID=A0A7C8I2K3_9PLEO|nr:hypothetical protein BDV95DRAFT_611809 [Massariosphaeria phaeospora]
MASGNQRPPAGSSDLPAELMLMIASYSTSRDMAHLGMTCRQLHNQILATAKTRKKYFEETHCDGVGMRIRGRFHQPPHLLSGEFYEDPQLHSQFSPDSIENLAKCGAHDQSVVSQLCDTCLAKVCNECRLHAVYQCLFYPAAVPGTWLQPGQDFTYLGYAFLESDPRIIVPPGNSHSRDLWKLRGTHQSTHNDLGYGTHEIGGVSESLRFSDNFTEPQRLEKILNVNLGFSAITYIGPLVDIQELVTLHPFNLVTQARKRFLCLTCYEEVKNRKTCACILAKRFVNRWICLKCHLDERAADEKYAKEVESRLPPSLDSRYAEIQADVVGMAHVASRQINRGSDSSVPNKNENSHDAR